MRNSIINLTNKETSGYNSNTNEDLINNKNNITNNHDNNFKDINNKYKYEKIKKIKRKFFEESKINEEISHNYKHFNDQAKNNGLFRNYVNDSFKNGNNDLITHYTRKRNMKSYIVAFMQKAKVQQKRLIYSQKTLEKKRLLIDLCMNRTSFNTEIKDHNG